MVLSPPGRPGSRRVLGELVLARFRRGHQDEAARGDLVRAFMARGEIPPLVIVVGAWYEASSVQVGPPPWSVIAPVILKQSQMVR